MPVTEVFRETDKNVMVRNTSRLRRIFKERGYLFVINFERSFADVAPAMSFLGKCVGSTNPDISCFLHFSVFDCWWFISANVSQEIHMARNQVLDLISISALF